ncbi:MAG: hypothetical protein JW779_03235 [Candidatus Thorarchaeota archaeon]|nr:hypothetical protein [Candidatus Thorarchaeota archaeon]
MQIPENKVGILVVLFILFTVYSASIHGESEGNYDSSTFVPINLQYNEKSEVGILSETGNELFEDNFTSIPLGFNISLWNISTQSDPPIIWEDGEWLVLEAEPLTYSILKSVTNVGSNVIAEFNITYTEGLCYFGIGWGDRLVDSSSNWRSNLRQSENGVFIDYWDNELCLVTYCNGERVAAPIHNLTLNREHVFTIEWRSTLVRLFIDNQVRGTISRRIPQNPLPFVITTSGHYETSKKDQLRINCVKVSYLTIPCSTRPSIELVWPMNQSQITTHDSIDFDVINSNGVLLYSWNKQDNATTNSPWDIPVISSLGSAILEVFVESESSIWNSMTLQYEIVHDKSSFMCPMMRQNPIIDGIIDVNEKQQTNELFCKCMNENRETEDITIHFGFPEGLFYIGIDSEIADKWNSRISVLIDADGDSIWDVDISTLFQDIRISVGTPSAFAAYTGIYTPLGQELSNIQFPRLTMASSNTVDGLSAEFILNLECLNGNATSGIGIGVILSRGGYDSVYPSHLSYGCYSNLILIQNSGVYNPDFVSQFIIVSGSTIISLVAVFGVVRTIIAQRSISLHRNLDDEYLERIKVLLYSYDRISIERLTQLTGIEKKKVIELVRKLIDRGFEDINVIQVEQDIIRNLTEIKKKEKVG